MQREQRRIAALASALTVIAAAGCQSDFGATGSKGGLSPDRVELAAQFNKIDTAHKGQITLDQATAYYAGVFRDLDKNKNGFLDKQELEALIPIMGARTGEELLSKLDRDWDGKLSQAEFLIIVNWLFQPASTASELTLADVQTGTPNSSGLSSSSSSSSGASKDPVQRQGTGMPGKR